MAKSRMLLLLLAHSVTSALLIDVAQITVFPKQGSVSGVFHASQGSSYAFSASAAREVCAQLGVVMADKAQMEKALAQGFETCRFGWIDEQVAVVPRIHPKESCGKGKVGLVPWRANLTSAFDVFCFNSTDYEAGMNTAHESPSTTVTPTAHTSGSHPLLAQTTHSASQDDLQATSSSQDDLQATSSSLPVSLNDAPESQAFSNTSPATAVVLIALLTTVFAFLLLAVAAVCYFKKNSVGRWNKSQQKESIEAEICGKTGKEAQAEMKTQHNTTSNTNEVSVTIKPENENEEPA